MNIYHVFYVGIGGFFGSIARYLVAYTLGTRAHNEFPVATITINVIGSFLLGIVIGIVAKRYPDNGTITLVFGTGFCGGFTTFSTFALENLTLWHHKPGAVLGYIAASVILGIAAVGAGLYLGKAA